MITPDRIRELRSNADLRQEDLAFLLGVGVATILRWEKAGGTLPTGLPRQLLEIMDDLDADGFELHQLSSALRHSGNLGALRLLLNSYYQRNREK